MCSVGGHNIVLFLTVIHYFFHPPSIRPPEITHQKNETKLDRFRLVFSRAIHVESILLSFHNIINIFQSQVVSLKK